MTLHEIRAEAERSPATVERVEALVGALTKAAASRPGGVCAVCGRTTDLSMVFVLPVTYLAAYLVRNQLADAFPLLPLRRAPMCDTHRDHFGALFVDVTDSRWDVGRLERRAEVLGGVLRGGLLVFGGAKALTLVNEFHEAVSTLRASVKNIDP